MASPMYLAELKLSKKTNSVIIVEKTNPALKKGPGMMIGPVPRSKLIVENAALLTG